MTGKPLEAGVTLSTEAVLAAGTRGMGGLSLDSPAGPIVGGFPGHRSGRVTSMIKAL
jgi:hypothetical protein